MTVLNAFMTHKNICLWQNFTWHFIFRLYFTSSLLIIANLSALLSSLHTAVKLNFHVLANFSRIYFIPAISFTFLNVQNDKLLLIYRLQQSHLSQTPLNCSFNTAKLYQSNYFQIWHQCDTYFTVNILFFK